MREGQTFEPAGRLAQFMRVLSDFERDEIEAAVDGLIGFLDALDGDADAEDATGEEDAFEAHRPDGPGCPVADSRRDQAWIEHHTRGSHKLTLGGSECIGKGWNDGQEDTEDADPAEEDGEDCCAAADDDVRSGEGPTVLALWRPKPGDDVDAEFGWSEGVMQPSNMARTEHGGVGHDEMEDDDPAGDTSDLEPLAWPEAGEGKQHDCMGGGMHSEALREAQDSAHRKRIKAVRRRPSRYTHPVQPWQRALARGGNVVPFVR